MDPVIPRKSREDLRAFIKSYLGGDLFLSANIHPQDQHLTSMIFMPLLFGALSYPNSRPEVPEMPTAPLRPTRPVKVAVPVVERMAALMKELAEARQALVDVDFKERWGEAGPGELETAKIAVNNVKDRISQVHVDAEAEATENFRTSLRDYRMELVGYREARRSFRSAVRVVEETKRNLQAQIEAWETARDEHNNRADQELGVIYAPMKDAAPRGINGYPIFFSCDFLHKEDWAIARKVIEREQARQKDLDLGDEDPDAGAL